MVPSGCEYWALQGGTDRAMDIFSDSRHLRRGSVERCRAGQGRAGQVTSIYSLEIHLDRGISNRSKIHLALGNT
jgi:hypothetical protein